MNKKEKKFQKIFLTLLAIITCFGPGFAFSTSLPPVAPTAPENPYQITQPPAAPKSPSSEPAKVVTQTTDPVLISPSASVVEQPVATEGGTVSPADGPSAQATETTSDQNPESPTTEKNTSDQSTTDVSNNNQATVQNDVVAGSSSGNNKASRNTGDGSVKTGGSDFILNFVNMINSNFVTLPGGQFVITFKDIYHGLVGDYIINPLNGERYSLTGARLDDVGNSNTGADSTNRASVTADNNVNVVNNNNASLVNNFDLSSNSGGNKANENTGSGSIVTGDTNLSFSLMNFINTNLTVGVSGLVGVINIFGDWVGNLVIPKELLSGILGAKTTPAFEVTNNNTGAGSENTAAITDDNSMSVANLNNGAVSNNIRANVNTGGNSADRNTGDGQVITGGTSAVLNVSNLLNKNVFGDTLLDVVVNVMGSWTGLNLLSGQVATGVDQSSGATTIGISNVNTGADSVNGASLQSNTDSTIVNNNVAAVNNNISARSNTGGNESDENTGSGNVVTGSARLALNIANFINTNIVANRLVYLVINVFGKWKGNITDTETSSTTIQSQDFSGPNYATQTISKAFKEYTWTNYRVRTTIAANTPDIGVTVENNQPTAGTEELVLGVSNFDGGSAGGSGPDASGFLGFVTANLTKIFFVIFVLYVGAVVMYLIAAKRKAFKERRML